MDADRRLLAAGRILISLIFVLSGLNKIAQWDQNVQYMASAGMPFIPVFLAAAAAIELLGGISLFFGILPRGGAALLALYLVPVTLVFHRFWTLEGMDRQMQMIQFMKNLAIIGGLISCAVPKAVVRMRDEKRRQEAPDLSQVFNTPA